MHVDSRNQTHETWLSERMVAVIHPGDFLICEQFGSTHGIHKKYFLSWMELEFWLEGGGIQKCKMIDPVHWSPRADVPERMEGSPDLYFCPMGSEAGRKLSRLHFNVSTFFYKWFCVTGWQATSTAKGQFLFRQSRASDKAAAWTAPKG